jgi:Tol biopolymer transport system component
MPLAAGQRLGSYEILALIGAGGMGEVYRARDTRLERTVAIKVLPEHVAVDPDLKQRFEREAKAISSLNHPHICTLYDVGSENGVEYLVMEYLEGETLTLRLLKGAIPFPLVLRYAVEIAEALDKAHRQGITHRDLKPGNVMLTKGGAKLLDFGLAKLNAASPVQVSSVATASPDLLTASGTILGTLQYMAPEQLEGKPVDHRADIFSFGAIVYEMATGKKAFEGDSQARLIGAILKDEPRPVSTLQPLSQPVFDALIATCLAKDPDDRWQSAGDIGRQLRLLQSGSSQPSLSASSPAALAASPPVRPRGWRSGLPYALTAVAAAALGAAVYGVTQRAPREPPPVTRFVITPPADAPLANVQGYAVAISPDGRRVAYVARTGHGDGTAIYVRDLDGLEARAVPGTETAAAPNSGPFFSADARSLAFPSAAKLMRVAVDGGAPLAIADLQRTDFSGGVWTADGTAIFSDGAALRRVSAGGGGTLERLTPDAAYLVSPALLPGARALLFGFVVDGNQRVAVLDLASGTERVVAEGGMDVAYSSGYLIFARGTTLMAQPFDPQRLDVTGEPVAVLQGVRRTRGGAAFAVAANGTLAYVPGGAGTQVRSALVWVDRSGRAVARAIEDPLEDPSDPRLSPDGHRIALSVRANGASGPISIWVHDLDGRPPLLLASVGVRSSVWSPDGKTIAFASNRDSVLALYTLPADGSARDPQLAQRLIAVPAAWTSAGEVISWRPVTGNGDIVAARVDGQDDVRDVVATPDAETYPSLSPDEHWLAYASNRTGTDEVWVKRYPDGAPVRVSRSGGREPVWSRDGRELFYRRDDTMLAVAVEKIGEALSFKAAVELFKEPSYFTSDNPIRRSYDVATDGRFLMIQPEGGTSHPAESDSIVVIENWIEEVKRRVPAR